MFLCLLRPLRMNRPGRKVVDEQWQRCSCGELPALSRRGRGTRPHVHDTFLGKFAEKFAAICMFDF